MKNLNSSLNPVLMYLLKQVLCCRQANRTWNRWYRRTAWDGLTGNCGPERTRTTCWAWYPTNGSCDRENQTGRSHYEALEGGTFKHSFWYRHANHVDLCKCAWKWNGYILTKNGWGLSNWNTQPMVRKCPSEGVRLAFETQLRQIKQSDIESRKNDILTFIQILLKIIILLCNSCAWSHLF